MKSFVSKLEDCWKILFYRSISKNSAMGDRQRLTCGLFVYQMARATKSLSRISFELGGGLIFTTRLYRLVFHQGRLEYMLL